MTRLTRRATLAAGLAATGTALLGSGALAQIPTADVPPPEFPIEPGAKLQVLRPSKFVQGDETLWLQNSAKFTAATGVEVAVDSESWEDSAAEDGGRRERRQRPRRGAGLAGGPAPLRRQARPARRAGRLSRPQVRRLVPGGRGLREEGGPLDRHAGRGQRQHGGLPPVLGSAGRLRRGAGRLPRLSAPVPGPPEDRPPVRPGARQRRWRQRLDVLGALGLRQLDDRRERARRDRQPENDRGAGVRQGALRHLHPRHARLARSVEQQGVPRR